MLSRAWSCDSAPCLGMCRLGSRAGKTCLRIQTRQISSPLSSLVKTYPSWVMQLRKGTGWDYCMDTAGMNSFCQDPCTAHCEPLPLLQIPLQIPLQFPQGEIRVRTSHKVPTMLGNAGCLLHSLYLLEELEAPGRPL